MTWLQTRRSGNRAQVAAESTPRKQVVAAFVGEPEGDPLYDVRVLVDFFVD